MKILTAIGEEKIIKIIKNGINCELVCKDILYEEGIIEFLEINCDVNFIIINYNIITIKNIENLVEKINGINKKIKIILLIKENEIINNDNIICIENNNKLIENLKKKMSQEKFDERKNKKIIKYKILEKKKISKKNVISICR